MKEQIEKYGDEFRYLFDLQMSGRTNMMGAGNYLQKDRGLSFAESKEILLYWMANYEEIAKELQIDI